MGSVSSTTHGNRCLIEYLNGYYSTYVIFHFGDIALRVLVMCEHTLALSTDQALF